MKQSNFSFFSALYYSENEYCSLSDDNGSFETEHDYRKKQLALKDPVHVIVLEEYFKSQVTFFCLLHKTSTGF